MPLTLPLDATVLFQGDSITDAGRRRHVPADLGDGYAALAARRLLAAHPGVTVLNRGVAGDRVADLRARWEEDTLAHGPDLLSIMVGVNDTLRRDDAGQSASPGAWEEDYRSLLLAAVSRGETRLVLIEPFLVPVAAQQWAWREDLDPRIGVVRRLAAEFDAQLLAADGLLNQAARSAGRPELVAFDGVHPTPFGHRVLADAWCALVLGT
ncbi:GDSL-type esterase/lipase family protein [Streptomyces sp. NRRL S-350]|uniref:GDSL-type esterase/lipase family protein n=1 Tax=Streptomyces sp. NRRL S-350 TaxID=1463902 RepID=UPI0004BF7616|nr:GDSL-type esterase/lipase family protein [Streptomyces sp. NRRL S-350]